MTDRRKKKLKIWQKIVIGILAVVGAVAIAFAGLVVVLTVTEYKPAAEEQMEIKQADAAAGEISPGTEFTILSWNTGFAAQGEDTDCFMDGGKSVIPSDEETVKENLQGIAGIVNENDPDIVFFQEVDTDSKRSYHMNEYQYFQDQFAGYSSTFALNYSTLYVPYPFPTTYGKVNAGQTIFSKYTPDTSTRISLPCPFSWPVSTANLKRCLLVDRIKVSGSDKELVLVNLHLEAYDDGEGKAAQTKQLYEFLQSEDDKGNYVIAGGDFNQTFSNCDTAAYPEIDVPWQPQALDVSEFGDDFTFIMDNSVPTCRSLDRVYAGNDQDPESFQYYMIDGFIVSSNVTINDMETLDEGFVYSDHNPIQINVTLKE